MMIILCSSLVAFVLVAELSDSEGNNRIELQLAHFSVKKYLMSYRLDSEIALGFQKPTAGVATASLSSISTVLLCLRLLLNKVLDDQCNKG